MGNAEDLARRRMAAAATRNYNPKKVNDLVKGLIGQMRMVGSITSLEMIGVGDGIFITVASTLLEVAEPGAPREAVRKELVEILDRMRRDIETTPSGSPEVM
jgi:hypothetical protein